MAIELDENGQPLSLPFDPEQTSYVRMRQADIARLFQVTPAAVSQWVKTGKITAYADGTIDPAKAARELARNCNIHKLRAKPFKPLRDELEKARADMRAAADHRNRLLAELADVKAERDAALRLAGESVTWLETFTAGLEDFDLVSTADDADAWAEVVARAFDHAGGLAQAMPDAEAHAVARQALADAAPEPAP